MNKRLLGLIVSHLFVNSLYPATDVQVASKPVVSQVFAFNTDTVAAHKYIKDNNGEVIKSIPVYKVEQDSLRFTFCSDSNLQVYHMNGHFLVYDGKKTVLVSGANVDQEVRSLSGEQLNKVLENGTLEVSFRPNGEYVIKCHQGLKGGGIIGAKIGFYVGRIGAHVIGQAIIFVTASVAAAGATAAGGPLAGAGTFYSVAQGMETALLPKIEMVSRAAGLGCGILGGVFTGPA